MSRSLFLFLSPVILFVAFALGGGVYLVVYMQSNEYLQKENQYAICGNAIKESLDAPDTFWHKGFAVRRRANINDDGSELDVIMHYNAHDKYAIRKKWEGVCRIKNDKVASISKELLGVPGFF